MLNQLDFTKIATEFGLSVALLVALFYALYRTGTWLGKNVVKPLADRHVTFVEKIEKISAEQAMTLQEIARTQEKQTDIQREEVAQLIALKNLAQQTLDNVTVGRDTAVALLQKDHQEILRRLPEGKA